MHETVRDPRKGSSFSAPKKNHLFPITVIVAISNKDTSFILCRITSLLAFLSSDLAFFVVLSISCERVKR